MRTHQGARREWPAFVETLDGHAFGSLGGRTLERLADEPHDLLVAILTAMEREPGLPAVLFGRIARFKGWLGGAREAWRE